MKNFILFFVCFFGISFNLHANPLNKTKADKTNLYNLEDSYDDKNDIYSCNQIYDPYEKINRKVFLLNSILDAFFLKPTVLAYYKFTPKHVSKGVKNFLSNIMMPLTTVNSVLQGKAKNAFASFWSFAINSTLGIGGIFNLNEKAKINVQKQTFGSTLAKYGVGPGAYVVLPIFGSTNLRDMFDLMFLNDKMNVVSYTVPSGANTGIAVLNMIHKRSRMLSYEDYIRSSVDSYQTLKDMQYQARESELNYPKNYVCFKKNNTIYDKN